MLYLNHFAVDLDEEMFLRKLLITYFQMNRCALTEHPWSGKNVSAVFHVEILICPSQILFVRE